jgi:hypothetical protein
MAISTPPPHYVGHLTRIDLFLKTVIGCLYKSKKKYKQDSFSVNSRGFNCQLSKHFYQVLVQDKYHLKAKKLNGYS